MYDPAGGYPDEVPYVNSAGYVKSAIQEVYARGSTIELEIIVPSIADRLARFADEGVFDRYAPYVWLQHAGGMGSAANPRSLVFSVHEARAAVPERALGHDRRRRDHVQPRHARDLARRRRRPGRLRGRTAPARRLPGPAKPRAGRRDRPDRGHVRASARDARSSTRAPRARSVVIDETRTFNAELERRLAAEPPVYTMPVEETRRIRREGGGPFPPPVRLDHAREITISGRGGALGLRSLAPNRARGAYLHVHGGGWTFGAADMQDGPSGRWRRRRASRRSASTIGSRLSIRIRPRSTTARTQRAGCSRATWPTAC